MLIKADARKIPLKDKSVHCCVTSPPYWGLRDYGHKGQIGMERTYLEYIESIRLVAREIWRVLKDDGTLWLNMGDSYATGAGKVGACPGGGHLGERFKRHFGIRRPGSVPAMEGLTQPNRLPQPGLKRKDLIGIPWRIAFAMQEDGWYLRSDIIWHKPNPTPGSAKDRPTTAHEYLFLLSKKPHYYYDSDSIKEKSITNDPRKPNVPGQIDHRGNGHDRGGGQIRQSIKKHIPGNKQNGDGVGFKLSAKWNNLLGKNIRSVWTIPTYGYSGAHFATFPPKLIEPCILAGCPPGGIVLDPFVGSGTTCMVALDLGRKAIGLDLGYQDLQAERIGGSLFAKIINHAW